MRKRTLLGTIALIAGCTSAQTNSINGTGGTNSAGGASSTGTTGGSGPGGSGTGGTAVAGTGGGTPLGTGGAPVADPCAPNAPASIMFSAPSGAFQGELSVQLQTALAGAEIRYTIDRSAPTASSTLYAGTALKFTNTTQLRAQPFRNGAAVGPPSAALYVARAFDQTHDLPLVVLDAYGHGALNKTDNVYVDVAFLAYGLDAGSTSLAAPPQIATRAGFHIRGQSSATFAKPPYRIELRDAADADVDCPLMGMPAESDWALITPFPDKALIRNAFVYSLGREMGMPTPRFAFAEVYLNLASRPMTAADYVGVYMVTETIKNQKNRLDLQKLKAADITLPAITGGYIFKFDWMATEEPKLLCMGAAATCWADIELVDPAPPAPEQKTWITQHLQSFNDAMHATTYADPTTGYPSFLNVPSFVDFVIINEITRNMDAYVRSSYFYKDRDTKISAGPLWDYDLTMDVGGAFNNRNVQGWQYQENAMRKTSDWFQRLVAEPGFKAQLVTRWKQLRQGMLSEAQVDTRIAMLTTGLAAGAQRNFVKWNNLTASMVGPFTTPTAATWDLQVKDMRDWLVNRMIWLDSQWQ